MADDDYPGEEIRPGDPRYERARKQNKAKQGNANGSGKHAEPLERFDHTGPMVARAWTIDEHIPANNVTLLSGEGAVGKSILALQLAACTALNAISEHDHDWIGLLPKGGPAIVVSCEEDGNEQIRRLEQAALHYHTTRNALVGLHMFSWVDQQQTTQLAVLDRKSDSIKTTPLYERLLVTVAQVRPKLIVLDTAADLFGGNEISRGHTRQFIAMMRGLAIAAQNDTAVLLLTHPSLEGIRSGSGLSGSTAWHNSVRARCVFKRLKEEEDDDDPDLRVLEWRKNNYGPPQETSVLRYRNGVYVRDVVDPLTKANAEVKADGMFMELLFRMMSAGQNVSSKHGPTYAPNIFAKQNEARNAKIKRDALEQSMHRLLKVGKISIEISGSPSKQRSRLVPVVVSD